MRDSELIANLVREALEHGGCIEIDGLGTFQLGEDQRFSFTRRTIPKVFIAYAHEDAEMADSLFDALACYAFDPWMDRRKLLPGQNWPRAIHNALETSDFVLACFSTRSVGKKGGFQAEVRYALDCAARIPLDEIFLVPLRLDECRVPSRIQREVQYVDLFPDWNQGFQRVLRILRANKAE